jgi:SAM-dependent methyltransferase
MTSARNGRPRTLDEVDFAAYDFVDFGAGTGGSLRYCTSRFGGRGVGIDISEDSAAEARAGGGDVVVGDIRSIPDGVSVRYVTMFDFLEHLPTYDDVAAMLAVAARIAREFIWIRHPSFEDEAYLRALGLKQYWCDWTGHPSHVLISDFAEMLRAVELRAVELEFRDAARSSTHPTILPLDAPPDQHEYDERTHGPKPHVEFAKPVYRQIDIRVPLPAA